MLCHAKMDGSLKEALEQLVVSRDKNDRAVEAARAGSVLSESESSADAEPAS